MRKIIVSEFISVDGVFEAPGLDGSGFAHEGWTMPYGNDEFMKFKSDELFAADALLLGRVTYDGFAKAWPAMKATAGAFGERMNAIKKYVVSDSFEKAEWENSAVIKENVVAEIAKLKQAPSETGGGDNGEGKGEICVFGSGMLTQTLLANKLVDEIRLLVYPVLLGTGKKFFKDGKMAKLALIESRAFKTGVVLLRYQPAYYGPSGDES